VLKKATYPWSWLSPRLVGLPSESFVMGKTLRPERALIRRLVASQTFGLAAIFGHFTAFL
jgi:hypothetical protein